MTFIFPANNNPFMFAGRLGFVSGARQGRGFGFGPIMLRRRIIQPKTPREHHFVDREVFYPMPRSHYL
jgi:hypothetical protein